LHRDRTAGEEGAEHRAARFHRFGQRLEHGPPGYGEGDQDHQRRERRRDRREAERPAEPRPDPAGRLARAAAPRTRRIRPRTPPEAAATAPTVARGTGASRTGPTLPPARCTPLPRPRARAPTASAATRS